MDIGLAVLFLISHILGDFYFKSQNLTRNNKFKCVFIHSIIYQCLFLLLLLITGYNFKILIAIIIIGVCHFVVESLIFLIKNNKYLKKLFTIKWIKNNGFFIRQVIHIVVIFICLSNLQSVVFSSQVFLNIFAKDNYYLRFVMAFLLVDKPSNVFFKKIFMSFKPADSTNNIDEDDEVLEEAKSYKNAGAAIGSLERIFILICLINELYSSIGLILTAKSIARYNRISNEPEFSEYYLLGSLSSVLFTIIIYFLCFKLIS